MCKTLVPYGTHVHVLCIRHLLHRQGRLHSSRAAGPGPGACMQVACLHSPWAVRRVRCHPGFTHLHRQCRQCVITSACMVQSRHLHLHIMIMGSCHHVCFSDRRACVASATGIVAMYTYTSQHAQHAHDQASRTVTSIQHVRHSITQHAFWWTSPTASLLQCCPVLSASSYAGGCVHAAVPPMLPRCE